VCSSRLCPLSKRVECHDYSVDFAMDAGVFLNDVRKSRRLGQTYRCTEVSR